MALQKDIQGQVQDAMRAKDVLRLSVLRGLLSAFTYELVATKRKPSEVLPDTEALAVIARAAKQRKDSIAQFEKGGRTDLSEKEKAELTIIEEYLPSQMSAEEILKVAKAKKETLGISDKSDIGKLMNALMADLKGRADGATVKDAVNSLF